MANGMSDGESRFYTAADGLRLHMRDYHPPGATRIPAVCLAGLTRSADDFDRLARALAYDTAHPRRVVAFDYRGRGLSDHDPDWQHYNLAIEQADCLAGLALCGIEKAHFIGTSRGGLHVMALAPTHRAMIQSAVLNDIGPVLEPAGLLRIKTYIGKSTRPRDFDDAIARLKAGAALHFTSLSPEEWQVFATTTFGSDEAHLGPRYDQELAHVLDTFEPDTPLPDMWAAFDALTGLPLLTIRGEHSDLLSPETCAAMQARWPGCETLDVPGQGHAPLLADFASIDRISRFLIAADTP